MTFREAFEAACATAVVHGRGVRSTRFRNFCCQHNDGEYGVWYRVTLVEGGKLWPCYDECGTPVKERFMATPDMLANTWELEA